MNNDMSQKFIMATLSMPDSAWDFIVEMLLLAQDSSYETGRTRFLASEIFEYIDCSKVEVTGADPFDLWDYENDRPRNGWPDEDSESD